MQRGAWVFYVASLALESKSQHGISLIFEWVLPYNFVKKYFPFVWAEYGTDLLLF